VMAVVTLAGVIVFLAVHRGREIDAHLTDAASPPAAQVQVPLPAEAGAGAEARTGPENPQTP